MNILLTGTKGSVGGHLWEQLKQTEHQLTSIVRKETDKREGHHDVIADLDHPESLKPYLMNQDVFFLLLRSDESPERFENNKKILELAQKQGVKKIVVIMDKEDLPTSSFIQELKMNWVILRPVEFMKNILYNWIDGIQSMATVYTAFPKAVGAKIHEFDIADVALKTILSSEFDNQTHILTGPEALSNETIVDLMNVVLDTPILLENQTEDEVMALGLSMGMEASFVQYFLIDIIKEAPTYTYTVLPTVSQILGRPARTYKDWISAHKDILEVRHDQ